MPTTMRAPKAKRIVHQRAKGPVDPSVGQRVRSIRIAKRLTQSALAGEDFSKGFISLVETGRTRMSMRAMQIIADRLSVPLIELIGTGDRSGDLELQLTLARAETEVSAGRGAAALELIAPVESRVSGVVRARLQRLRGRALMQLGRPRDSVAALDEAARLYRAAGERGLVARVLFDLAEAHARLEQHGEAINLAVQSERALSEGDLVDRTLDLQLLVFLASEFVTIGDFQAADLRAERAKAIAEDVSDPRTLARLYEELAVTRQAQGDLEAALAYSRRALATYEQQGNQAAIGSSWNTIGWVHMKRGQISRASDALDRAEKIATSTGDNRLTAYVLQTRAEIEQSRGRYADAIEFADASIRTPGASPRAQAISLLVRAESLAQGDATLPVVKAAFRKALDALEPQGRQKLARAYRLYFESLAARGQGKDAIEAARTAIQLMLPSVD